jgi:hypothetical protein
LRRSRARPDSKVSGTVKGRGATRATAAAAAAVFPRPGEAGERAATYNTLMRRLPCLLALACLPLLAVACTGADANRAHALLQQAQAAQQSIRSEGFVMQLSVDAEGHSGGLAIRGGAQLKGASAGDFYLTANPTGALAAQAAQSEFTVVRRGSTITVRTPAGTRTMPVPQAQSRLGIGVEDPAKLLALARYVKSVSVGSTKLDGEPADRIVGKIDTSKLLGSLGGQDRSGLAQQLLHRLGVRFGDIDAVLFLARDSHLVRVMFADMNIGAGGRKVHIHLSIVPNDVNRPVDFPTP